MINLVYKVTVRCQNYDISLNSSAIGEDACVDILENLIKNS